MHKRITESYVCKGCGMDFHPKGYDRITYCSRECAYKHRHDSIVPKPPTPKEQKKCSICGELSNKKECSDVCRLVKANGKVHNTIGERACAWCNDMFMPTLNAIDYTCCCLEHRKQYDKMKKKLHKGAVSKAKRLRVWKRDGYICQICGKKIGKIEQPTVDHIIPISIANGLGWSKIQTNNECNLQTAHLLCNVKKGNRAINEQLMMSNAIAW